MSLNSYEIPILLSSDNTIGAFNVSAGNDKFDVRLPQEILIPNHAKNITAEVQSATIWNTAFNISDDDGNNKFYLDVSGDAVYTVTIPNGLYDLSSFAHAVNVGLVNQGLANDIITFSGDHATQKVILNFSIAGLRVDFTGANNCNSILGFNSVVSPTSYTTGILSVYGDNSASFDTVDYFLIHSNIVTGGIPINGVSNSVISRVLISSSPGTQILYEPVQPVRVPANHLEGYTISQIHSWITDQSNGSLDFNNENWSYQLIIRYKM